MKFLFAITINLYLIYSSYGRLLYKTTETPKTGIEHNGDTEISKKEKQQNFENYLTFFNRKARMARDNIQAELPRNTTPATSAITKTLLVKKPIPKFHDESDEDYQNKMRMPSKSSETVEHEDEDFNVDDYDFDVNHDEFAGRGKPLEPRRKVKLNKLQTRHTESKTSESKLDAVATEPSASLKARNIVPRKVADKMKEEEYDDEFSDKKTTESSSKSSLDDDDSDENDDSKEFKDSSGTRTIRSPWNFGNYVNKLGEKTSDLMSRVLSVLPMFPQQLAKKLDEDVNLIKGRKMEHQKILSEA